MSSQSRFELLIATLNAGKVREIETTLSTLPIRFRYLSEFPTITQPIEDGSTYEENATIKAISYAKQTRIASLADDSGLEVRALNGEPGVLSARYAGPGASDQQRIEKLLAALTGKTDRAARFVCTMALAEFVSAIPGSRICLLATGTCTGIILDAPRGGDGFGFDPVFLPDGQSETFAEMPAEIKNRISHRGKALASIRAQLERRLLDRPNSHP